MVYSCNGALDGSLSIELRLKKGELCNHKPEKDMDLKHTKLDIVSLPTDVQITLYLIREGLKARRLFDSLTRIGFDESAYYSDNVGIVLAYMGFDESDDTYNWYNKLLGEYANVPQADRDDVTIETFNIYVDLLAEKSRQTRTKTGGL
jgi:hypothetical protein